VEFAISDPFDKADILPAVEIVRSAVSGIWVPVGNWACMRRIDQGKNLPPVFDADGGIVFEKDTTGIVVRWEEDDERPSTSSRKNAHR
jgi:hypothetical protein